MRPVLAVMFAAAVVATADAPYPLPPLEDEAKAANLLETALAAKNPDVRKAAVASLSLAAAREPYLTWLESMIGDKDVPVRTAAIASLVDLKNPRTIPVLRKALHDPTPEVSFAAARALWTLNDPYGRTALISVLGRDSKTSSNFISSQMRDTLRLFHTPREMFMFVFKNGIGFAPVPGIGEGVSSLQEILADPGISGRAAAALLLASDKTPEVLAALRDALSDKDASVRAAAVHAIAMRGDPALIETIRPLMGDMKEPVRLRAAAGYLRLAWIGQSQKYSAAASPKRAANPRAKHP